MKLSNIGVEVVKLNFFILQKQLSFEFTHNVCNPNFPFILLIRSDIDLLVHKSEKLVALITMLYHNITETFK